MMNILSNRSGNDAAGDYNPITRRASGFARNVGLRMLMVFVLVGMALSSCGLIPTKPIEDAIAVIDNGIRDIEQNSTSWQSVLQRVANQLPQEISETVRVDAQSLATRSIATGGIEFRCNIDFLGNRAIQSLQRLKAELLNENPPPLALAFCQVDPASIDLKVSPSKWSTVVLYGYDFDHKDKAGEQLKVLLLNSQGGTTPLSEDRIGRTTHYQITLNLGDMARQFYNDQVTKIVVSWNGTSQGYPQIVVVPWEGRRRIETVNIGSTGPYYPKHIGGSDSDFDTGDDEPTALELRGEMRITDQLLSNRIYMHAREVDPDHTEVEGWSAWSPAYPAPQGWRIVEVRPGAPSSQPAVVTLNGRIVYNRPAGEVVNYFEVWVDQDGDEAGTWSRVIAHWRPLEITIEEVMPEWLR